MQRQARRFNRHIIHLTLDSIIFIAFLVAMAPHFSGIAIHEWLSIAFGAAIIVHLLLNWVWIVGITKRLFGKVRWSARFNYALNLLLFIDMTIVIFTGLMISESALPMLGMHVQPGGTWHMLHTLSANLSLFLIGLHLAVHWHWIVQVVKRYVLAPLLPQRNVPQLNVPSPSSHREA